VARARARSQHPLRTTRPVHGAAARSPRARRIHPPLSCARSLVIQLDTDGSGDVEFAELMAWYLERMQDYAVAEAERRMKRGKWRVVWEDTLKLPRWARIAIGWLVNWLIFTLLAVLSVTFALTFGEERFDAIITSWGIGLGQTFAAEEPVRGARSRRAYVRAAQTLPEGA